MIKIIIFLLIFLNSSLLFSKEVTFKWKKARWAISYEIQIAEDINYYNIKYVFGNIKDISLKVNIAEGVYYFRITGMNKFGVPGPFSKSTKIKIEKKLKQEVVVNQKIQQAEKQRSTARESEREKSTARESGRGKSTARESGREKSTARESGREKSTAWKSGKEKSTARKLEGKKSTDRKLEGKKYASRESGREKSTARKSGKEKSAARELGILQKQRGLIDSEETNFMIIPSGEKYELKSESEDVENIFFSIDYSDYKKFSAGATISFNTSGSYKLAYYAQDFVGNKSLLEHVLFEVDGIPPEVQMNLKGKVHFANNIYYILPGSFISFSANDNIDRENNIFVSFNNADFKSPKEIDLKMIEQETNIIKFYAVDYIGNKSKIFEKRVLVDTSAPKINYSFEGPSYPRAKNTFYIRKSTKIKVSAIDPILDVIYIEINDKGKFIYKSPFFIDKNEAVITISAMDKLGNKNEINIKIIKDETPPMDEVKAE